MCFFGGFVELPTSATNRPTTFLFKQYRWTALDVTLYFSEFDTRHHFHHLTFILIHLSYLIVCKIHTMKLQGEASRLCTKCRGKINQEPVASQRWRQCLKLKREDNSLKICAKCSSWRTLSFELFAIPLIIIYLHEHDSKSLPSTTFSVHK